MTRSFGGGPDRQQNKQPELRADDEDDVRPGWQRKLDSLSRYSDDETLVKAEKVDFGKRLVAGIIDVFAAYLIGAIVGILPLINDFLNMQLVMALLLTMRDWFFDGRGIGKNLMGLQVVDVKSGRPCSFMQSIKRNIVMLGPPLALYVFLGIFRIINSLKIPFVPMVSGTLLDILNSVGFLYVMVVIPYEAYQSYNRADGRRFGDQLAGTAIVEAPMDFSTPIPR